MCATVLIIEDNVQNRYLFKLLFEQNGHQVAEKLCTHTHLTDTPVVAVTSYAMTGDREKALAAGCSGYIEKPINPKTFIQEVENYLK